MRYGPAELRFSVSRGRKEDTTSKRMGRGFASRLVAELEGRGREVGVSEAVVHAVGAGKYAWAQMGFDLDIREFEFSEAAKPDSGQIAQRRLSRALGSQMLEEMQKIANNPQQQALTAEFAAALEGPEHLSLQAMSQWGRTQSWLENGEESWLGKAASLGAGDWFGRKNV